MFRPMRRFKQQISEAECKEILKNKSVEFYHSSAMMDILTDFPFLIFTAKKTTRFIFTAQKKATKSTPSKITIKQASAFMIQVTVKKANGR